MVKSGTTKKTTHTSAATMAMRDTEEDKHGAHIDDIEAAHTYSSGCNGNENGENAGKTRRPRSEKSSSTPSLSSTDSRQSTSSKSKKRVSRAIKKSLNFFLGKRSSPSKSNAQSVQFGTQFTPLQTTSETSPLLGTKSRKKLDSDQTEDLCNNDLLSPLSGLSDDPPEAEIEVDFSDLHDSAGGARNSKSPWGRLREHVHRGDVLLMGAGDVSTLVDKTDKLKGDHATLTENGGDHDTLMKKAFDEIRSNTEFNIKHCLAAILIYMAMAVVCYNWILEPEWTIVDCCYFAVVTFSTVGYGDISPTSELSMIFTCFYAIIGIIILGNTLGIIGSNILATQQMVIDTASDLSRYEVLSVFDVHSEFRKDVESALLSEDDEALDERRLENNEVSAVDLEAAKRKSPINRKERHKKALETFAEKEKNESASFSRRLCAKVMYTAPIIAILVLVAWIIGHTDGQPFAWDLVQTAYYLVVTACTIGYGDMTPKTQLGKIIATIFIPIACGAVGQWLGSLASSIIERRAADYWRQVAEQELTEEDLRLMDMNGDGNVSRAEFLEFMLIAMGKIDQEIVDELRVHFDKLDSDGTGELSRDDLIESARRKIKSPRHKLQLSAYKSKLIEAGDRTRMGGLGFMVSTRNMRSISTRTGLAAWGAGQRSMRK